MRKGRAGRLRATARRRSPYGQETRTRCGQGTWGPDADGLIRLVGEAERALSLPLLYLARLSQRECCA